MELNGRTVHFKRTIWATNAIMQMCPGKDLTRFGELFEGGTGDQIFSMSAFIAIMSEAHEQAAEFEAHRRGEDYQKNPVTIEEIMALEDMDLFTQLQEEAVAAWANDGKQTVESQPPKSSKKKQAKA